jgi:hypothetical protein
MNLIFIKTNNIIVAAVNILHKSNAYFVYVVTYKFTVLLLSKLDYQYSVCLDII